MVARGLDPEILSLRTRLAALLKEAATNEKLLKKTQQREMELLKAGDLPKLFEVICDRLSVSYGLEIVTLVLFDPDHEVRHLLLGAKVKLENYPNVLFMDDSAELLGLFGASPQPWLGAYLAARHRAYFKRSGVIKSIALIPLWQQKQLLGCICFGSHNELRFTRDLGTEFLAHLGVIASFAVENAVNRARLVQSGMTDFLTGWHNRRYLHERLQEELARAQRTQSTLGCLLLDLDYFKTINDTHGHLVGDLALQAAAERINQQIRGSDAAARFGGDEFVVITRAISEAQAMGLAERMRQAVNATPLHLSSGETHALSVSVGVALMKLHDSHGNIGQLADKLVAQADAALYRAKQNGRNRVEINLC